MRLRLPRTGACHRSDVLDSHKAAQHTASMTRRKHFKLCTAEAPSPTLPTRRTQAQTHWQRTRVAHRLQRNRRRRSSL
eukprot:6209759-Pleurochrysis_carterae.AAC.1